MEASMATATKLLEPPAYHGQYTGVVRERARPGAR